MATDETITLDPNEFIPERFELGLDELGIRVRESNWGDSEIETFLVRQALGEIPADRHPPNRNPVFKLMVEENSDVNLAEAAQRLQQKVGIIQRESGFVRRDLDSASGFKGPVAARVHAAALSGLDGWMMAHRKKAPDVTLSLVADPYLYGVQEIESELIKAENAYYLKWELADILGSAPGLMRVAVKNEGASHWKGLLAAIESRDHPQDATKGTTADLAYECEALTLKGVSAVAEVAGASGGKVVQNTALTSGYIQVLGSKIAASGLNMTHIGPRRFWLRASDPGAVSENIELRVEWRPLGSTRWNANPSVKLKITGGNFCKLDMGEVRPETAVIGEQRWEWKIAARARNGAGSVRLDLVYLPPTEQYLEAVTPDVPLTADLYVTKSPVTAANDASFGTQAWTNPANAITSNNVYATCIGVEKQLKFSQYLKVTNFGFAIPGAAQITGVLIKVERKASHNETVPFTKGVSDSFIGLVKAGAVAGESRGEAYVLWSTAELVKSYGGSSDLFGTTLTPADVNSINFGAAVSVMLQGDPTASVDNIEITVYYTEGSDENRVCFATRSVEMRTDGLYRQHPTDDIWARGVPDGFLPVAPPSGLENRAARGIIIPSVGDHDLLADTGNHKLSARIRYFPGYHFTSEAQ